MAPRHHKDDPRAFNQSTTSLPLPPLTIRNITIKPTRLTKVERLQYISSANERHWSRIFSTSTPIPTKDFVEQDVDIQIEPLEVKTTTITPNIDESVRLTFATDGQLYQLQIPTPTQQSTLLKPLAEGPKEEYTAIFLPATSYLTLYSSAKLESWMSELKDITPLSALSIPGTHNSPTCYSALPTVRCQGVSVQEQLNNGIRFLDIRVSPASVSDTNREELHLVHSVFPISLTGYKYLRHLVDEVTAFLSANPTEAVLISIKREGYSKATDEHVSKILRQHYAHDPTHWFTAPRIPALGEVRGKIVLVRRFHLDEDSKAEYGGAGWGIDGSVWPDNCEDGMCGSQDIRIQDFYDVTNTTQIEQKIRYSQAHLTRAAACVATSLTHDSEESLDARPNPIYINFLSAANFFKTGCWPDRIAARVNPQVVDFLCRKHSCDGQGDGCTGIVVCDWLGRNGDWDLVRCIVGQNSRLLVDKRGRSC